MKFGNAKFCSSALGANNPEFKAQRVMVGRVVGIRVANLRDVGLCRHLKMTEHIRDLVVVEDIVNRTLLKVCWLAILVSCEDWFLSEHGLVGAFQALFHCSDGIFFWICIEISSQQQWLSNCLGKCR